MKTFFFYETQRLKVAIKHLKYMMKSVYCAQKYVINPFNTSVLKIVFIQFCDHVFPKEISFKYIKSKHFNSDSFNLEQPERYF